ncbi:uncharacterized protein E0L32_010748 [Thyridium curvatum]|uniref:Uncharacterized protein n=1 Tax=Thyridium curvatum TaxID=1093900 RepID=A0A507ALI4_9PEZI|nr:uncharacterized protein E0L32_010748 [Thyridium curvatum]TPX07326.1 hypothetical protein E0L32_010748 [Thyridium curvatum]
MAFFKLTPKRRLMVTIGISFSFFVAEIAIAFLTKSLALLADAFHYMNDLIGFIVALVAIIISEQSNSPQDLSFGWARARLLGAFFNGVFLFALGISIFLQSIERFISLEHVQNPKLVLIMGCVGLGLNLISAAFLHEHDHGPPGGADSPVQEHTVNGTNGSVEVCYKLPRPHAEHRHNVAKLKSPGHDLGMLGVLIHVIGDAINNIGVIISALVIWLADYDARFYADPGTSVGIAFMILISAIPLVKNSGTILLQSAPRGVNMEDVKHDLEKIDGIESIHELHIWRLDQKKAIASAHVVVEDQYISSFMDKARTVSECLHAYGIHSATLQPEVAVSSQIIAAASRDGENADSSATGVASIASSLRRRRLESTECQILCGSLCEDLMCCK